MSDSTATAFQGLSTTDNYYACTYSDCGETFTIRHNWRRHENSQHDAYECWRCEYCTFKCWTATTFVHHLQSAHGYQVDEDDEYIDSQHVHRDHQGRFWCGFCAEILPLYERGLEAWIERFEHIEQHFLNGSRIKSWEPV
jgi:hypothetical protein